MFMEKALSRYPVWLMTELPVMRRAWRMMLSWERRVLLSADWTAAV